MFHGGHPNFGIRQSQISNSMCYQRDDKYTKAIPKKKKCKKAKWLSEEALQTAEKRKGKGKGEMESYIYLKAEFQRIARGDKKAFLRDQCKEIEGNSRMGKI